MNKNFPTSRAACLRTAMLLPRAVSDIGNLWKNLSRLRSPSNLLFPLFFALLCLPRMASGQTPVPMTATSFNWDAVGELNCFLGGLAIVTPGGMDASGYAFAAAGRASGGTYTLGGNTYNLQSYGGSNALRVLPGSSATLTLASATRLANLRFLVTSTEGSSTATYTANFTDATSQTLMTASTPDWIIGGGTAISDAMSVNDCDVKGTGHLFDEAGNVSSANYGKFVQSITVSRGAGGGRLFIFGASSCGAGAFFNTCPGNISVSCPGAVTYTASATGATSLTYTFSGATSGSGSGTGSGSSFNVGVTNVVLTATNSCGTQTCSFSVTVDDNTPPTALCKNITLQLDNSGNVNTTASAINNGSFDNCGGPVTLSSATHFNCGNIGSNSVILTVTDAYLNSATCTATVTVQDPVPPNFVYCPSNMTVNAAPGTCGAKVCYPLPEAGDNCNPPAIPGYTYYAQDGTIGGTTRYYYYSNSATDWFTADAAARAAGGHLAVFMNNSQNLTAYLNLPPALFPIWIGGTDAGQEGVWRWITCHTFGYTNWYAPTGEPNNAGGIEHHMQMYNNGTWNDYPGSNIFRSILEIDGSKTEQTGGLAQNSVFPVGTTVNTFLATDAAGNTSSCQFTVTVVDNQPPTITCPGNIAVNVTPGLCTAPVTYPAVTGADNCSFSISRTGGLASGSLFPVGVTTNTFVATDAAGNTASCSFTVTVSDNQPPTAICQNISVNLAGSSVTITASQINNGSFDLCGGITLSVIPTTFNCNQVGNNLVALKVTDASGNMSSCNAQVTVVDNTPPVAVCQNIPVALVGSSVNITPAQVNGGSSDNCSFTLSASPTSFNCSNVGPNNVTLTVISGTQSSTCTAVVTVVDNTLPVALCQNITVLLSNAGMAGITAAQVNNGSSDNCGFSLSASPTSFTCANVGTNNVTLTVTDASNNFSTCPAVVTVVDNIAPVPTCENAQTISLNGTCQLAVPNLTDGASATDNCATSFTWTQSPSAGALLASGEGTNHTVTVTVNDGNGNSESCQVELTGNDDTAPAPTCESAQTISLNGTCQLSVPNLTDGASATDNCATSFAWTQSPSAGTLLPSGEGTMHTVTVTVNDGNGNSESCQVELTGNDVTDPVPTCENAQTISLNGTCQLSVPNLTDGASATDNCATSFTWTQSPSSGTLLPSGEGTMHTVTVTANDGNGNSESCEVVLTGNDDTAPAPTCEIAQTIALNGSCQLSVPNLTDGASATDNCATSFTWTQSPSAGALLASGEGTNHTVTVTVNDGNGNSESCQVVLTGNDDTAPAPTCEIAQTIALNGSCQLSVPNLTDGASATDNCATSFAWTQSPSAGTLLPSGEGTMHTVTVTVNDGNGNSESCQVELTGNDDTAPAPTCESAQTISLNGTCQLSVPNLTDGASATDNCATSFTWAQSPSAGALLASGEGTTHTVTVTANDGNGNSASCQVVLTGNDDTNPVITCPSNITGLCGPQTVSWMTTATDNCASAPVIICSPSPGSFFNVGTTTVSCTANDGNGNSANCSFTVTVYPLPNVTITPSLVPYGCQGLSVLNANVLNANVLAPVIEYNWSNGSDESGTIITSNGTYSVQVTDGHGCASTASITTSINPYTTLSTYTMLSTKEIELKESNVNGGVGMTDPSKKAKIKYNSAVNGFVQAADIDLNSSTINGGTSYPYPNNPTYGAANVTLPSFQFNTLSNNSSPDLTVNNGQSTTIGSPNIVYDQIEVKEGATLIVGASISVLYVRELKTKNGASIVFQGNTQVRVQKKVDLYKNNNVGPAGGNTVNFWIEEDFSMKENSNFTGNIYALKKIESKGKSNERNTMSGIFISEYKIDSDWTNWNGNACSFTPPLNLNVPSGNLGLVATLEDIQVHLQWVSNMNGDMEVERSSDGVSFATLLRRESDAGASAAKLYRDYDLNPAEGVNYYRVKQAQPDGSLAFSPIREVAFNPGSDFIIFPNPASDRVNVYVKRFLGKEVDVVVSNQLGQELYRQHIPEVTDKLLPIELDRNTFREGLYSVSIIHLGKAQTKRLVLLRAD